MLRVDRGPVPGRRCVDGCALRSLAILVLLAMNVVVSSAARADVTAVVGARRGDRPGVSRPGAADATKPR